MTEKTNYQISTAMNEGILEIVITGEVTKYTVGMLHDEIITMITMNNDAKALLTDVRDLKGFTDELSSAYYRARSIPSEIRKLPSAIVDRSVNSYHSFYETTSANVGQKLKWFTEIEVARTWLKELIQTT